MHRTAMARLATIHLSRASEAARMRLLRNAKTLRACGILQHDAARTGQFHLFEQSYERGLHDPGLRDADPWGELMMRWLIPHPG